MKELTSRERLTRIFNHQDIDRIPMWMLFPSKPWQFACDVFAEPSYQEVNRTVFEKTDIVNRLYYPRKPFLNAHPDVRVSHGAGGSMSIRYKDLELRSEAVVQNGRKTITPLCETIEDFEALLDMPFRLDLPSAPDYADELLALGDRGIPCIMMPDPLEFAHAAFSETEFPVVCFTEQARMKACLDELQRRTLQYYEAWLQTGMGDVYWINGCEYIVPPILGPNLFGQFAADYDRQLVDLVRGYGKKSMIHCHGRVGTLLSEFKRIGMDSLHPLEATPMGDCTLAQAREALGPDTIFVGNMQYGDLFYGFTEDQIEQMTLDIIEESRKGPIILAITASPIVEQLPPHAARNYLRIIETCLTKGHY